MPGTSSVALFGSAASAGAAATKAKSAARLSHEITIADRKQDHGLRRHERQPKRNALPAPGHRRCTGDIGCVGGAWRRPEIKAVERIAECRHRERDEDP